MANTKIGDIGMMVCWDAAHPELWRRYAGKVDLMLLCSCPPQVTDPTYIFPDGVEMSSEQLGRTMARLRGRAGLVFGEMIDRQAAWLGVPVVNAMPCGVFNSYIPRAKTSLLLMLPGAPWLARYLRQADQIKMTCNYVPGCKIVNKEGQVLSAVQPEQGECLALAEVNMADEKHSPQGRQPRLPVPWLAYFLSDFALPRLSIPVYKAGLRQASQLLAVND
jgi:predicted amidohydrolase